MIMIGIGGVCCLGQEFIKSPKVKKVYVSCQQYIELVGDLIMSTNNLTSICADVQKISSVEQKNCLDTINDHVDGEKDCFLQQASKVERSAKYTKLMKVKEEFERARDELCAIQERLHAAISAFHAQK